MKQFLTIALITLMSAFAFVSCSQEDFEPSKGNDGIVEVSLRTTLPEALATYADEGTQDSKYSGLKNLEGQGYMVRYVMEVYPEHSTELVQRKIYYASLSNDGGYKQASFNTRLVASTYRFVFWADIVSQVKITPEPQSFPEGIDATQNFYGNRYFVSCLPESDGFVSSEKDALIAAQFTDNYMLSDLQRVDIATLGTSPLNFKNGEQMDAFTCVETLDLRVENAKQITLKRPFAKLRVITTDYDVAQAQGVNKDDIFASFSPKETVPSAYNALTGESSGRASLSTVYNQNAVYNSETGNEVTVGTIYILPLAKGVAGTQMDITIRDNKNTALSSSFTVDNVPLAKNKITTIKGKLFSKNAELTVNIDDAFDNVDDNGDPTDNNIFYGAEASTPEELFSVLTGETQGVTYTGRVTKENGLTLNFENATRSTSKFAEGNTAILAIKIPNIEDDAVITILGGDNLPSKIILNTGAKCSVRINANKARVELAGNAYGLIVYNCSVGQAFSDLTPTVDAFLIAEGDYDTSYFFPENEDFDMLVLDSSFNLTSECDVHTPCALESAIKEYLNINSGKTVFDYVGDKK